MKHILGTDERKLYVHDGYCGINLLLKTRILTITINQWKT